MNKRSFLILLFLCFTCWAKAQEKTSFIKERFFNLGFGYALPKFIDHNFSSLRYSGNAVSAVGGFHFTKPTHLHYLDFRFDYGELSNVTNSSKVDYFRFEGNYAYKKYITSFWSDRIRWYGGGSVNGLWTLWVYNNFVNNAYNNSVYTSISPNVSFIYDFELFRRQFRAEAAVFIPILTFAMRPSYGSSSFSGFLDNDRDDLVNQILESGKIISFNKFFRYSNTFSLEYHFENFNRLKLSYQWDFSHYSEPRVVKAASHNIIFSTMFNF